MRIHYSAEFIYYLSLIPLKKSSKFKETYIFLMDYPSTTGKDFTDYHKKATWNLLHAYIYSHGQILIDEYPGDGV